MGDVDVPEADVEERASLHVRVVDAGFAGGGPVRIVVSGLPDARRLASELDAAEVDHVGRLTVTARVDAFVDTIRRRLGEAAAVAVEGAVEVALTAHGSAPEDIATPAGAVETSRRTQVMGVLNVTPDSFSDGGANYDSSGDPARAIRAGEALLAEGADIVDVGGESTRPGSQPVAESEELRRVVPVVAALAGAGAIVSIDTTKAVVARAAVEAGAALVNDVSGGAFDDDMWPTVADLDVPYVLMHIQGRPRTMQRAPSYEDVVAEVFDFLATRLAALGDAGIAARRVIVDPGIGFGKTAEHNLALLGRLRELCSLGRPVLVGASRKGFLGRLTGVDDAADRLEGSLAVAAAVTASNAAIVRVHDVAPTIRVVRTAAAIRDAATAGRGG